MNALAGAVGGAQKAILETTIKESEDQVGNMAPLQRQDFHSLPRRPREHFEEVRVCCSTRSEEQFRQYNTYQVFPGGRAEFAREGAWTPLEGRCHVMKCQFESSRAIKAAYKQTRNNKY